MPIIAKHKERTEVEERLHRLRHSAAHLMAEAVQALFPEAKLAFGPAIDNGFYYDFDIEHKFSEDDLRLIEKKMEELRREKQPFVREEIGKAEALKLFLARGEKLKAEHVETLEDGAITLYHSGKFADLCAGPHVEHTGEIKHYKLTHVSGSYWRGDENREQLQRIYGTAWETKEDLVAYVKRIEEAKKRDHRILGKELRLFEFPELAGPGLPFYLPKGAIILNELKKWMWDLHVSGKYGHLDKPYEPLATPHILQKTAWETSGHMQNYRENMFLVYSLDEFDQGLLDQGKQIAKVVEDGVREELKGQVFNIENNYDQFKLSDQLKNKIISSLTIEYSVVGDPKKTLKRSSLSEKGDSTCADDIEPQNSNVGIGNYGLKPMNCPGHVMLYNVGTKSYRDMPARYFEFGTVYRYERAGTLHGMLRVRSFTQDDAHIFCTPEQYAAEVEGVFDFCCHIWDTFGFDYQVGFKTRGAKRIGGDDIWDMAEAGLRNVLEKRAGGKYYIQEGDATFYGPKVDFVVKDSLGRDWQGSTIQLDFNLPERFGLEYSASDGERKQPVMIHRAILGSFERFFGLLVEEFGGAFPLWLAPVQARVLPIGEDQLDYARLVAAQLKEQGLRAEVDESNEKLGKKIRNGKTEKIPYLIVVGAQEQEQGAITVESYFDGKLEGLRETGALAAKMQDEIAKKVYRRRE